MQCPECESEMDWIAMPTERSLFMIPFTDIEIRVMNWGAHQWVCVECVKEEEPQRQAYYQGVRDGYDKAVDGGHVF